MNPDIAMLSTADAIHRREAIKRVAALMGGVVSGPVIVGLLQGCSARPRLDWKPQFLSAGQALIVAELAEIIIPKTDTPGAKDVGVPAFIDTMLHETYATADQTRFIEGMNAFAAGCRSAHGRDFTALSHEKQVGVTRAAHDLAVADERAGRTRTEERPFILMVKELALLGYFTSEVGATQVLQYVPVPGVQKGCVPLSEAGNGRTWAI